MDILLDISPQELGPYLFFQIKGITWLEDGGFAVLNAGEHEVLRFDSLGTVRFSAGREGDGPGEFRDPTGIWVSEGSGFSVLDSHDGRVTTFDSDGGVTSIDRISGFPIGHTVRSLGTDGDSLAVLVDETFSYSSRSLTREKAFRDTIDFFVYRMGGSEILPLFNTPGLAGIVDPDGRSIRTLHPAVMAAYGYGAPGLFLAPANSSEIVVLDLSGRAQRTIRFDAPSGEEFVDLRDGGFVHRRSLLVSAEGSIWVSGFVSNTDAEEVGEAWPEWHVLDDTGVGFFRVRFPSAFIPFDVAGDRIIGVQRDSLGIESVIAFQVLPTRD